MEPFRKWVIGTIRVTGWTKPCCLEGWVAMMKFHLAHSTDLLVSSSLRLSTEMASPGSNNSEGPIEASGNGVLTLNR